MSNFIRILFARSSITGRFVTLAYAKKNPNTTQIHSRVYLRKSKK